MSGTIDAKPSTAVKYYHQQRPAESALHEFTPAPSVIFGVVHVERMGIRVSFVP
jgi:hypothetical protein